METNTGYLPLQWPAREHDAVVEINPSIWFVDRDGYRVVGRGYDTPLYRFAVEDEVVLRFVAVSLRFSGLVSQQEIAAAFGHSEETQRRWERRYEREGLEGLRSKHGTGRPQKLTGTQEVCIAKWFHEGVSNCEIARRLVVSESTIRHSLRRLGLRRKAATALIQQTLEKELDAEREGCEGRCEGAREGTLAAEVVEEDSTFAGEVDPTKVRVEDEDDEEETEGTEGVVESPIRMWISDPMDRSLDRVCAALGLINDAEPAFAEIDRLPRLGVLLAIPLLVRAGVLEVFQRVYGSIGPAFYGLRTTVVCLFLLALLRIKRPENLKEHNAQELGRLIGLDRAPEVKTLRRKLDRLASSQKGLELMRQLAQLRATSPSNSEALGTLYIDGHVKEYHGRCATGKAFISQKRLAAPGATDTWVNDLNGDPLFVVQSEVNAGLTKTLGPILEEIRKQLGPDRSITVVFDRGGFSPRLFYKLIASGYHLITYRKGHFQQPPVSSFEKRTLEIGSEVFHYELHDAPRVRVGKSGNLAGRGARYLWMRQVTRRREGHGQVAVITDRTDLPAERVLYLMFHRWRQENFFKYMKEEFELDALLKYGSEPLSETQDRPNPQLRKLDQELRSARAELKDAQQALGALLSENQEALRPTVRGFKIANSSATQRVQEAAAQVEELKRKRAEFPKRVLADDLVKLKRDRNLIADSIKMTAYQVESQLCTLLGGAYARTADEGRTFLHALFQTSGRIETKPKELRITLVPQSSPHRTNAAAALCEQLTAMNITFPGSDLRLTLAIQPHEPVKM